MKWSRKELEGEVQEVKPARDKGNAHAWCRPRGCRSRLPPASCACKTPTGKPTITEGEILWGSRNEGRSVAAAWNVHGEISRTGEVLEEKLSGPLVPQQSSHKADKGLGLKCTRNFQRCLLQTPLCSLPRHPPPSQAVAGCINTCKKLLVGKKSASAEPRRTTPAVHQLLLLTISPPVLRAKGAQSQATAGIDQKTQIEQVAEAFLGLNTGFYSQVWSVAGSATSLLLYQVLGRRQRAALAPGPFIFTPSSIWQHFRRETKPSAAAGDF